MYRVRFRALAVAALATPTGSHVALKRSMTIHTSRSTAPLVAASAPPW
jgi:hypothetical protein